MSRRRRYIGGGGRLHLKCSWCAGSLPARPDEDSVRIEAQREERGKRKWRCRSLMEGTFLGKGGPKCS
jgi:hypothetical protein